MLPLHKGNSTIDPHSGAIIFTGSPELRAVCELQSEIKRVNSKLDKIIELLTKGGISDGREVEDTGFSQDNDPKI